MSKLLYEGLRRKLTLISAPAGSGKTTLLVEGLKPKIKGSVEEDLELSNRQPSTEICWLSLDEGDNDPRRFWTYVVAALQTHVADIGQVLQAAQGAPIELALTSLVNELSNLTVPLALTLDDYHVIQSPAIHQGVAFLLDHLPDGLHLIITTRTDPPLPLAGLRARDQLVEIRLEDLRFALDEAAEFLRSVMGLTLAPDEVATLELRTEGWVSGLQLAALALRALPPERFGEAIAAFGGRHRFVADYLVEQVLNQQSPQVLDFLLRTSFLERLSAPLCDFVLRMDDFPSPISPPPTGNLQPAISDSQSTLEYLERANLFLLPLDEQRQWYRYHPLLSEVLRARLDPGIARTLHSRAAAWFAAQGLLPEAIQHALQAQDWPGATGWIKTCAPDAFQRGEFVTLRGWLEKMPEEVLHANGELAIFLSWGLWLAGEVQAAESSAQRAMDSLPADAPPVQRGWLLALLAELALTREDNVAALELSRTALDLIGEADPFFRDVTLQAMASAQQSLGDVAAAVQTLSQVVEGTQERRYSFIAVMALVSLTLELNLQGQRRRALGLCQRALDEMAGRRNKPSLLAGLVHAALGMLAWEADELETAQAHALSGLDACRQLGLVGGVIACQYTLAEVQRARGDPDTAITTLRESQRSAEEAGMVGYSQSLAALAADIELDRGDLKTARLWAEGARLSLEGALDPAREDEYLTHSRLLLAEDHIREAQALLTRLEAAARARGRAGRLIRIHILQARAQSALGNKVQAHRHISESLRLAETEGYRRAFLQEPAVMALLLDVRPSAPRFVDELLAAMRKIVKSPTSPLEEPLNERELEILRLIADGLTNAEIAVRLSLARSTVKWHINNLYAKLQARTRTQALAKAREFGLF